MHWGMILAFFLDFTTSAKPFLDIDVSVGTTFVLTTFTLYCIGLATKF